MKLLSFRLSRRATAQLCQKLRRVGIVTTAAGTLFLSGAIVPPNVVSASASVIALSPNHLVVNRLNVIRSSFGLSTGQMVTTYNAQVLRGLRTYGDPPFAPVAAGIVGEGSVWGLLPGSSPTNGPSPLVLVNDWVYHDGWNGSVQATWNADCTSVLGSGCNGHRRDILSTPPVPGAKLYIDVVVRTTKFNGLHAVVVAALLVWKTSSGA